MKTKIIILFTLLTGCNNNDLKSFYMDSLFPDVVKTNEYKNYIIIPNTGCQGCISNAEEFLMSNLNSAKYFFILTNYESKKYLRIKLGDSIFKAKNVFLDSTNKYYPQSFNERIYPISIYINNNTIENISLNLPTD